MASLQTDGPAYGAGHELHAECAIARLDPVHVRVVTRRHCGAHRVMASRVQELTWTVAGLLVAVSVAAWAIHAGLFSSRPEIKPGDEILSVLPESVSSVRFEGEDFTFAAIRGPSGGFSVEVTRAGEPQADRCAMGADLGDILPSMTTIRAIEVLRYGGFEQQFPVRVGRLTVQDAVAGEPLTDIDFRAAKNGHIAARLDGLSVATDIAVTTFDRMRSACRERDPARN